MLVLPKLSHEWSSNDGRINHLSQGWQENLRGWLRDHAIYAGRRARNYFQRCVAKTTPRLRLTSGKPKLFGDVGFCCGGWWQKRHAFFWQKSGCCRKNRTLNQGRQCHAMTRARKNQGTTHQAPMKNPALPCWKDLELDGIGCEEKSMENYRKALCSQVFSSGQISLPSWFTRWGPEWRPNGWDSDMANLILFKSSLQVA